MSDGAASAERQQARRQGLDDSLINLPLRLFGVLIASLLLSILAECIDMHLFWKDKGRHHSQAVLQYELGTCAGIQTERRRAGVGQHGARKGLGKPDCAGGSHSMRAGK